MYIKGLNKGKKQNFSSLQKNFQQKNEALQVRFSSGTIKFSLQEYPKLLSQ
jgi:hypothetical protein